MQMYPLKFEPIFKHRIWGGRELERIFGKDLPEGKIGESWELVDLPNDKSIIVNGPLAGETISMAISKFPLEIMGKKDFSGPFPLLIKLLDAEDVLSVQVHPDGQTCERMGTGEPKTECWYIISAQSGAVIYKGLKRGVSRTQFSDAIADGSVAELLEKIEVKPGQCHFLPAGTAHAIGAGLLIAEIQMPSDTTYRVFDWGRVDQKGEKRQLHIDQALESIGFETPDELSITTDGRLVDCEFFKIDKISGSHGQQQELSSSEMKVLIILSGEGMVENSLMSVKFSAGDCLLVPFACEAVMHFAQDTEYLITIL